MRVLTTAPLSFPTGKKPAKWITGADGSCVKSEEDLKEELLAQSRAEYGASSGACSSRAAAILASASSVSMDSLLERVPSLSNNTARTGPRQRWRRNRSTIV